MTRCGGVLIAASPLIVLRRRRDLMTGEVEDLWASFSITGRLFHVCEVYVKPSATDSEYINWFCKVESLINILKGTVLILGDLS